MRKWAVVLALILVLGIVPLGTHPVSAAQGYATKTIAVSPTDDAWVDEGGWVDYKNTRLRVGTYWGKEERAYLKFDLRDSIPPAAIILKATLVLHAYYHYGELSHNVTVYGVYDDNWSEKTIRWSNRPKNATGPLSWVVINLPDGNVRATYGWNVTSFVREQFLGDGVVSFYLHSNLSHVHVKDYIYFTSKDDTRHPNDHPELVVEYYVPISIASMQVSRPVIKGHPARVTVVAENDGEKGQNITLTLYVDGIPVRNETVFLKPGKDEFNLSWIPTETGVHEVKVELGPYDMRYADVWVAPDPNVIAYGLTPFYERLYLRTMANLTPLYQNFTWTLEQLGKCNVNLGDLKQTVREIQTQMAEIQREYKLYNQLKGLIQLQNPEKASYYFPVMVHIRKAALESRAVETEVRDALPLLHEALNMVWSSCQQPSSNGTATNQTNQTNTTQPSTGGNVTIHIPKVLIDDSHGQYYVDKVGVKGLVSDIEKELKWQVDVSREPLTYDLLKNYDVVILLNPKEKLTQAEISALQQYVENGGSLFVAADWYKYANLGDLNALVGKYGVHFNADELMDKEHNSGKPYYPFVGIYNRDCSITKFIPENWTIYYNGDTITIGGSAVWVIKAYSSGYSVDADGNIVASEGSEPIVAAAVQVGNGRIVVYGSSKAFSDSYSGKYIKSNWPFIKGALLWLAHEE
ncbi:DUF4350 domain-containing protein [Thermococcus sp.]|uniref:DUF4350 domain-containing protein n=1 Tax=Thermococcus sp. TaxID=35749 RepID=UPI0026252E2D|nr:DUF4350 domain-containing protein [Thermococcus sp.]